MQTEFDKWVNNILSMDMPEEIAAFNFNLYEGEDSFHIQIIGAPNFDEDDEDWACDEVFSTEENIFIVPHKVASEDWEEGLKYCTNLVTKYLESGEKASVLKSSKAVGIGFVDGDLEIIYKP